MKKKMIFFLFLFFQLVMVNAKEKVLTCEYYKKKDALTFQAGVLCHIYDDYTHQCYVHNGLSSASEYSNVESILNWSKDIEISWKAKDYIKANNKCPDYLVLRLDDAVNGFELHAAETEANAIYFLMHLPGDRYLATLKGRDISEKEMSDAVEYVQNSIEKMNNIMSNYDLETCLEEDNCVKSLNFLEKEKNIYDMEIFNYLNEGYFSTDDEVIKQFYRTIGIVENFLESNNEILVEGGKNNENSSNENSSNENSGSDTNISLALLCYNPRVARTLKFLGILIYLVKIFVPILIILLGSIDFFKAMLDGKSDELIKKLPILMKRFAMGVIIFLIPSIIDFLYGAIDTYSPTMEKYQNCSVCLLDPDECIIND